MSLDYDVRIPDYIHNTHSENDVLNLKDDDGMGYTLVTLSVVFMGILALCIF